MKITIILFLLSLVSVNSFSQESNEKINTEDFNSLFIIDSSRTERGKTGQWSSTTSALNYLLISKGRVVLFSSIAHANRYHNYKFYGDLENLTPSVNKKGEKVISFFVRGKKVHGGILRSFEITYHNKESFTIHFYNKMGDDLEVYFRARTATNSEKNKLTKVLSEYEN